jgi:hypothetical protein
MAVDSIGEDGAQLRKDKNTHFNEDIRGSNSK